jgi:cobalamin-dependent methionine synthase I
VNDLPLFICFFRAISRRLPDAHAVYGFFPASQRHDAITVSRSVSRVASNIIEMPDGG